ncbi:DNase I-like protein, partial [Rhizodiscina lignyota]
LLDLYILTFNCARAIVNPPLFAPHVFRALPKDVPLPDMVMFSLQEIAPISYSFLGGSYLTPYFEQLVASLNIAAKIRDGGGTTYKQILTRNLGMTAIMLFAREPVAERIQWIQTAGTGVGFWEMGNKGAVGIRLGYKQDDESSEEVELTLVAAHLAPMENALLRRNQDWKNIVRRLIFANEDNGEAQRGRTRTSSSEDADEREPLVPESRLRGREVSPCPLYSTRGHVFFAGDLNYRTSIISPGPDAYLSFPQPDASSEDPNHMSKLFEKDQLSQVMRDGEALQGFSEMPVTFPPTYKYEHPEGAPEPSASNLLGLEEYREPNRWNWAKHRFPSWCDRILYLPSALLQPQQYTALPLQLTSDHRPVALSVRIELRVPQVADNDIRKHPPFNPDPEWRYRRQSARRFEIIVGFVAYLVYTREGNGIAVGVLGGLLGCAYL